jgi:uncharacterized membrane protein
VRAEQEANASPNVKAKLEIEPLHAKIDALREQEIVKLSWFTSARLRIAQRGSPWR